MPDSQSSSFQLNTPVLLLVFNRPVTTARVFQAIRIAKPRKLYVSSDGPRAGYDYESKLVLNVRTIVTSIDWDCELRTLFSETNLGCKYSVSRGISWFFEHEEQGIILEDDTLPHLDFFFFCEKLLDFYKDNPKVAMITGCNFQKGNFFGDASFYFSVNNHIWGWASWRRVWSQYDVEMKFWPAMKRSEEWRTFLNDRTERRYWERIFDLTASGKVNTWDYQFVASVWKNLGLTATPNVNLISNIGFGVDATHTSSIDSPLANLPVFPIGELNYPNEIVRNFKADQFDFDNTFSGRHLRQLGMVKYFLSRLLFRFCLLYNKIAGYIS